MFMQVFRKEQLTIAAAVLFILSVGMASSFPSGGPLLILTLILSATSFVYLYVTG